jgi:hypothetical protein
MIQAAPGQPGTTAVGPVTKPVAPKADLATLPAFQRCLSSGRKLVENTDVAKALDLCRVLSDPLPSLRDPGVREGAPPKRRGAYQPPLRRL